MSSASVVLSVISDGCDVPCAMADTNNLGAALATAAQPSMVDMTTAISKAIPPRQDPATLGHINIEAAPGVDDAGSTVAVVAAPAATPDTGTGRDQPLLPPTAEARRIDALAHQVREPQR